MLANDGKPIDLDLSEFEHFLVKELGGRTEARRYIDNATFSGPLTLKALAIPSEEQLLVEYFDLETDRRYGTLKENWPRERANPYTPAFIAMLIELGYVFRRGDLVPILMISKPSP